MIFTGLHPELGYDVTLHSMKKFFMIFFVAMIFSLAFANPDYAQCSICAKSVEQMGTKPAQGFNSGIIYLMVIPYLTIGVIGYKWWKNNGR
jgi:hypothetical protein